MDLKAIKERLKKLQSTSAKTTLVWKPSNGENIVRIVPYQFDKDNPFIELYFHYNISKRSTLSLATFDEADPIVDFAEQLASTGVKEDWILSKKVEPKMRTYVPVIVRDHEDEGVKFWGFGKEVYTQLLEFLADPDYGDITDPTAGRDIVVSYTPGVEGKSYPSTSIRVKPNPSKMTTSKKVYELITTGQTNIFDIYTKPTYDELKSMLQKWLEPDAEGADTKESKPVIATGTKENKPTVPIADLSDQLTDDDFIVEEEKTVTVDKPLVAPTSAVDDFDKLFEDE